MWLGVCEIGGKICAGVLGGGRGQMVGLPIKERNLFQERKEKVRPRKSVILWGKVVARVPFPPENTVKK